jgi:hypothetical protein
MPTLSPALTDSFDISHCQKTHIFLSKTDTIAHTSHFDDILDTETLCDEVTHRVVDM